MGSSSKHNGNAEATGDHSQGAHDNGKDLSSEYSTPPPEPVTSFAVLKDRIRHHYELASEYYYSLWGEHIHHGYFLQPTDTKEQAQIQLIELLLQRSKLDDGIRLLDVGCGIGGTSRFLARKHDCEVIGITISGKQVEMATRLTRDERIQNSSGSSNENPSQGSAKFLELDAEKMGDHWSIQPNFDCVWISEALSHLPDKALFFQNAFKGMGSHGKLVIADWFKAEDLSKAQVEADIKPIEDGMLLPPLCTQSDYVHLAQEAGFKIFSEPLDISEKVAKTWEISWSLIQSPSLWAFAFSQGRDGIAFLQGFRAMRRGYANGTFRYAVMVFQKPAP